VLQLLKNTLLVNALLDLPARAATDDEAPHSLEHATVLLLTAVKVVQGKFGANPSNAPSTARRWCYSFLEGFIKAVDVDAAPRLGACVADVFDHVVATMVDSNLRPEFMDNYAPVLLGLVFSHEQYWLWIVRRKLPQVFALVDLIKEKLRTCGALTKADHGHYVRLLDAVVTGFPLDLDGVFDLLYPLWPSQLQCEQESLLALTLGAMANICRACAINKGAEIVALASAHRAQLLSVWTKYSRNASVQSAMADLFRLVLAVTRQPTGRVPSTRMEGLIPLLDNVAASLFSGKVRANTFAQQSYCRFPFVFSPEPLMCIRLCSSCCHTWRSQRSNENELLAFRASCKLTNAPYISRALRET
jgi:hypothetical protein